MFQTIEQTSRMDFGRRLLMMMVSIVGHAIAIFLFVILPLLFFNVLPENVLTFVTAAPSPPAPLPPPAPPVAVKAVAVKKVTIDREQFAPPGRMPDRIPFPIGEPVVGITGIRADIFGASYAGLVGVSGEVIGTLAAPPVPLPSPPKPVRRAPVPVGGIVQASKLIRRVDPVYPDLARRIHLSGIVVLEVTVDEEGNVAEIKVLRGHPLLDDEAVRAVRQWKYSPTFLNGEPVPVTAAVTVIFNLR